MIDKPREYIPHARAAAEAWHGRPVDLRFLTEPATGGSAHFAVAKAVAEVERAAIVAWLREQADFASAARHWQGESLLRLSAASIERGDHLAHLSDRGEG